jgi:desampylase
MNAISVPAPVRALILAAAAASPAREICGLLVGRDGQIVEAHLTPNRHPDPELGFAVCDAAHARLQRQVRARGLRIVGCFHSHPSGDANPSQTDLLAANEDGFLWLIATPSGALGLWRARIGNGVKSFVPLTSAGRDETAIAPSGLAV